MFNAIRSLYQSVSSCVRVNGIYIDWFKNTSGLRQGCSLSPILFNLFLNDLVTLIKATGKGVCIENETIYILLYADDIVLITENERDLQYLLDVLSNWCSLNTMTVNPQKSNIVRFRPASVARTAQVFTCGSNNSQVVSQNTYLGILLDEHLDFDKTAKSVAKSAGRALGLLIAKSKCLGGMPFNVFTKLYNSLVWPVISYGAAVWGTKSHSSINAVQNRAMRFFLDLGKYTPTAALYGELGWQPPYVKQWVAVARQWHRFQKMDRTRLQYKVYEFTVQLNLVSGAEIGTEHLNMINLSNLTD